VVRRKLAIFFDFRISTLAYLAHLIEINGETSLIEYMDTNGGSVNNIPMGSYEDLKSSLNNPTDFSFLMAEDCKLKNLL
jgi:hypothetical protein